MGFDVIVELNYGDNNITYANRSHPLGAIGMTPDGRRFRYALNGGTALEAGKIVQAFAANADLSGNATVFVTAGSTVASGVSTISILPTTGVAAGYGRGGYLAVQTSGAARSVYKVSENPNGQAASGSSANAITLTLAEGERLVAPVTTASRLALLRNPYSSVIVAPAILTAAVIGVPTVAVPANRYFWAQSQGYAAVEYNAGVQAAETGHAIQPDTSIAGAFKGFPSDSGAPLTTGASGQLDFIDQPIIGWADVVGADALINGVQLNIP